MLCRIKADTSEPREVVAKKMRAEAMRGLMIRYCDDHRHRRPSRDIALVLTDSVSGSRETRDNSAAGLANLECADQSSSVDKAKVLLPVTLPMNRLRKGFCQLYY